MKHERTPHSSQLRYNSTEIFNVDIKKIYMGCQYNDKQLHYFHSQTVDCRYVQRGSFSHSWNDMMIDESGSENTSVSKSRFKQLLDLVDSRIPPLESGV